MLALNLFFVIPNSFYCTNTSLQLTPEWDSHFQDAREADQLRQANSCWADTDIVPGFDRDRDYKYGDSRGDQV